MRRVKEKTNVSAKLGNKRQRGEEEREGKIKDSKESKKEIKLINDKEQKRILKSDTKNRSGEEESETDQVFFRAPPAPTPGVQALAEAPQGPAPPDLHLLPSASNLPPNSPLSW